MAILYKTTFQVHAKLLVSKNIYFIGGNKQNYPEFLKSLRISDFGNIPHILSSHLPLYSIHTIMRPYWSLVVSFWYWPFHVTTCTDPEITIFVVVSFWYWPFHVTTCTDPEITIFVVVSFWYWPFHVTTCTDPEITIFVWNQVLHISYTSLFILYFWFRIRIFHGCEVWIAKYCWA